MQKKEVLVANFVDKRKISNYLEMLKTKLNVSNDIIYVYSILDNEKEFLVTFKTRNKDYYLREIDGSSVMHVKNGCVFSINALNKLMDIIGVKDKNYKIDWEKYSNKLLVTSRRRIGNA